jgi:serine/threonine-protein kinase
MLGALVVAMAVVFGVVGAAAYMQASIPSHTVPDTLVGAQYDDALKVVEPFEWNVVAERTRQDGTVVGQVLASNPAAGQQLREGKKLVLTVSDGPTLVQPPEGLIGKTQEEATAMLAGVELGVEFVPQENNDAPEGTVIGFADNGPPADGFPKGSTVRLLVASDQEPEIPDLAGVPYQEAVERLEGLGLTPKLEAREPRDNEQPGTVVSTDPEAGTEVQPGDTVEVLVAVDKVEVPSVAGMSLDEARATLQANGLDVGHVFGRDEGTVVFTAPGAGSEVDVGTEVAVVMEGARRRRG